MAETSATSAFARLVPYRFRCAHHLWAWLSRYFWLPCRRCGKPFGGHELRTVRGVPVTDLGEGHGTVICPPCAEKAAGKGAGR